MDGLRIQVLSTLVNKNAQDRKGRVFAQLVTVNFWLLKIYGKVS